MYEELVKELRHLYEYSKLIYPTPSGIFQEAADAIEELSKSKWIKFKFRPITNKEKPKHPTWTFVPDCKVPNDREEVLVSDGKWVWVDTFNFDRYSCCFDESYDYSLDELWWMPMPEPPKEEDE